MEDPPVLRFRPEPSDYVWTFGGAAPVRSIAPGTIVETFTEDCFAGRVRNVEDLVSRVCEFPRLNPQTGPFYVEGAQPGDTLAVHFIAIEPARDWAVSTSIPLFGALTSTAFTATLQDPLPEIVWIYDVDRLSRTVTFHARHSEHAVTMPLEPMHGTVGVAPANMEVRSALTPGDFGGNFDTPEMRAGTTCYLGVNVEGALLSFGDGHCRQGEGESCGVAVEAAMHSVVLVELLKGISTPWPRMEDDQYLMSTGSARPLEDAFRISQVDMINWVAELADLSIMDAYQLVSQVGQNPVANVCDTNYTFVTKVDKRYIRGGDAYGGVHANLVERAGIYVT